MPAGIVEAHSTPRSHTRAAQVKPEESSGRATMVSAPANAKTRIGLSPI